MRTRETFGVVAALAAIFLSACAAASVQPSPTVTASSLPSVSPEPTAPPPTTASPSPILFLTPVSPPCTADHLEVRVGQQGGALGNGIVDLIVTDRGKTPCTLRGTPNVQLLDARGRLLTVPSVRDSPSGYIPTYPNDGVELLPLAAEGASPGPFPEGGIRGQASLPLQYGQDGCNNAVAATRVEVAGGIFTVPLTIPQPGAEGCEVTRMFVNPFQPAEFLP
jgi:hypothetical protein